MKREELKALGIEGETLEQVMMLHGKDLERQKAASNAAEAETAALREQLRQQALQGEAEKAAAALKFSSQSAREVFLQRYLEQELPEGEDTRVQFDHFVEEFRRKDPGAFFNEAPQVVSSTAGVPAEPISLREMGYQQRLELKRTDPEGYEVYKNAERM
jgi:hypothetical protein